MSVALERYRSADRLGLQPARPVRGRYEIHSPLEPSRCGWTFDYRPGRPDEPDRGEWVLWDERGREVYRQPGPGVERRAHHAITDGHTGGVHDAQDGPDDAAHLAEVGLLESLVVPGQLGSTFSLDDALWQRIDERHGLLLTPDGNPVLHVTLDEFDRSRQLRAQSAEGALLVAWAPVL